LPVSLIENELNVILFVNILIFLLSSKLKNYLKSIYPF